MSIMGIIPLRHPSWSSPSVSSLLLVLLQFICTLADKNGNCHQSFNTCLDSMKTHQTPENSIPSTAKEINETCQRFNGGMGCIHEYLDKCANSTVRALIEREITGAKRFYQHLCGSKKFQENYLYHTPCVRSTRPDWNECIRRYRTIIHDEIRTSTTTTPFFSSSSSSSSEEESANSEKRSGLRQTIHYCCAHKAYEKCVLNSAKFKCPPESVLFIRDVLSMERHINCVPLDRQEHCRNGASSLSFNLNANVRPVIVIVSLVVLLSFF